MSAGWVAATVRSRALASRRLGRVGARELAAAPDLETALTRLVRSPYGHEVHPGMALADAERSAVAAAVWNVRVLSGWLPRQGVPVLRMLAGPVEVANIVDHVEHLSRGDHGPPPVAYRLGALGTTWLRLSATSTLEEVRAALTSSPWGDPRSTAPHEIALVLRLSACLRIAARVPPAREWATGAAALLVAREIAAERLPLPARAGDEIVPLLGVAAAEASSMAGLVDALTRSAAWALAGVTRAEDLWHAEARWWARVERDAFRLARGSRPGPGVPVGVAALLATDAWRVRAALESAARHGRAQEDFDAVA